MGRGSGKSRGAYSFTHERGDCHGGPQSGESTPDLSYLDRGKKILGRPLQDDLQEREEGQRVFTDNPVHRLMD